MTTRAARGALTMRVAAWQSRLRGYDPNAHADVLGRCADQAVDLLVLPECYFGGMPKSEHAARRLAVSAPYPSIVEAFTGRCPATTVVTGFVERAATGRLHSSTAIIQGGPGGWSLPEAVPN